MKKAMPILYVISMLILIIVLLSYDNPEEKTLDNQLEVKGIVLETDESEVIQSGISKIGYQTLMVEIIEGKFKGQKVKATNQLIGKLDYDNFYMPEDKIVIAILHENDEIIGAKAIDIYRQGWQLVLFGLFVLCLIIYAGFIGVRALFSFIASLFIIWKLLIPGLLSGKEPLMLTALVLTLLSGIIIFAVAGFTKKGLSAFVGTMCGLLITVGITMFFGSRLSLYGMTSPFAESLIFSGYLDLNMKHIFYSAIIIGASGAAMDIAMDVAASMEEIKSKKPDIGCRELIGSGFNVGKAVIGTMTTTLLLAYSGGYLTLLMLFMTKNSSFGRIINLKIVSAEIMRTVVGSIGLVLVAPLTALFAGWIYSGEFIRNPKTEKTDQRDNKKLVSHI
ncbi:YibE/F family protein [Wukongibacter sp. M2B1]|uniref:YibE/F family protein n=1 Tax=Wukongibacter sp. M2B1 TaxID=3088895 RepID=UPI003D797269